MSATQASAERAAFHQKPLEKRLRCEVGYLRLDAPTFADVMRVTGLAPEDAASLVATLAENTLHVRHPEMGAKSNRLTGCLSAERRRTNPAKPSIP